KNSFQLGTNKVAASKQHDLQFQIGEIELAIYAKLVKKCGNPHHWEEWAKDIATIAQRHIERISQVLNDPKHHQEQAIFNSFAQEMRDDLHEDIADAELVEMLAQHLITQPVFNALFASDQFAQANPISQGLHKVLQVLHHQHLDKETDTLQGFYASVQERARGIDTASGKQRIILELYDKFFRSAFPKLTERLGIVYTPVEVVDFILHSINHLLQQEFQQSLNSENVHILDPFTGTGTFVTRLMQTGLIAKEHLSYKYQHELHANEVVLLAYYIATVNIEATYHAITGDDYQPFPGICLTDTFSLTEKADLISDLFADNSTRRQQQKQLDIRIIIGNPPYSAGQTSANDNNQNLTYPQLDKRIAETYAARSTATNKNSLYDSYIRAIRWASDRIQDRGIIGFVTNAGFLDAHAAAGVRQCLAAEFSSIHIVHLRGNQRTSGEISRKEGGKIFGSGSRAPIAISILVKNPQSTQQGKIYFHDIGDYLTREEKLNKLSNFSSIVGITDWQTIQPDQQGDWLQQRRDDFAQFIALGNKKDKDVLVLFANYSRGVATSRDAWCYNSSREAVATNMQRMIAFYNSEVTRFNQAFGSSDQQTRAKQVGNFINNDSTQISWALNLKQYLLKSAQFKFDPDSLICSLYRPFTKQWLYFSRQFNEGVYQIPRLFPDTNAENLVICVTGLGAKSGFSVNITDKLPDIQAMANGQCFPLYIYDTTLTEITEDLFSTTKKTTLKRQDGITDAGLAHFQAAYPETQINKEDIFYYTYAILHCPDYRTTYANNLSKELPRIPCVTNVKTFWQLVTTGRTLADLHINYETAPIYPAKINGQDLEQALINIQDYRVTKMRYGKNKDKTTIIYNDAITISDIPIAAYDYIVNGKTAIDWIVERQGIRTDKASGINNDANTYATETIGNPRYPLELLLRIITVSLETMKLVAKLPRVIE
ncbi:damage-inducible protein, partial [Achromatium sp. WMS3]